MLSRLVSEGAVEWLSLHQHDCVKYLLNIQSNSPDNRDELQFLIPDFLPDDLVETLETHWAHSHPQYPYIQPLYAKVKFDDSKSLVTLAGFLERAYELSLLAFERCNKKMAEILRSSVAGHLGFFRICFTAAAAELRDEVETDMAVEGVLDSTRELLKQEMKARGMGRRSK